MQNRFFKNMNRVFIGSLFLLFSLAASANDKEIGKLFSQQNIEGTMVISSLQSKQTFIHNDARAEQRFSTASTFKILNTLISLEEKAIAGRDDVFKWDGHVYDFPSWNQDQTLASAFKVSCVWCYQELARKVGEEKYREYIKSLAYGELREPFNETLFWLDGSLQISVKEQIAFLKKVYLRLYPFSGHSYETLRQIMVVEKTPDYTIRAKTGWAARVNPQVGWYVGYVETPKDVWFFATNMVIRDVKDLPFRQQLTNEALRAKGIIQ